MRKQRGKVSCLNHTASKRWHWTWPPGMYRAFTICQTASEMIRTLRVACKLDEPRKVFASGIYLRRSRAALNSKVGSRTCLPRSVNLDVTTISWSTTQEVPCRTGHVREGHHDGLISTGVPGTCPPARVTCKPSLLKLRHPSSFSCCRAPTACYLDTAAGTMSDSNVVQNNE